MPRHKESFLRSNLLTILTVCGVLGGTLLGCILRSTQEEKWTPRQVMYLQFPGDIFLRMLKALIIPLLVSSVIGAIGSLDLSLSKKIAMRSILFYATTTVCAVILGIILVVTIRPGTSAAADYKDVVSVSRQTARHVLTQDTLLDLIRNLFPPNLVQATIAQTQTKLVMPENATGIPLEQWKFYESYEGTTNVLGMVVFGVVMGISLGTMGEKGKPLLVFFETLSEAMMIITSWVIWISPLGVFFLVSAKVMETESFGELVGRLGMYFMTVMLGLFLHGFGTLSVIYFICTRTLPFKTIGKLSQVLVTAFGTASSSATMPITIQTLDRMGVDPRVTRFVIPVGATINMDGTALYEAIAAIFIAQFRSIPLSFGQVVAVSITATAASIGAAGIPQAGLVTMVMVLDTVGLPAEDVTLILAVDWLLDRFRTTINVMCDSLGARLVDMLSKGELGKYDDNDKNNADPHELVEIAKDTRI
ncbi:PREDICTED: excitatory amino acid transporter 1 [Nicrophorus vespilloides]|uniref:Amino acid transporter n=1 Tax=Nicrophorus vespilloides TaxID=110193 RepID=A0ABM1NEQ7_NICVS|nr:PREDICTED: excitatory amino acid transporter 1 [Nicrophorus vespilloides]